MQIFRRKKVVVWLTVVGIVVVAGGIYALATRNNKSQTAAGTFYPKASATVAASSSPSASTSSSPAVNSGAAKTPIPIPTSNCSNTSTSGAIVVTSPTCGATVSDGTAVTGSAQVFEGTIRIRLKGAKSGQLVDSTAQVSGDASQLSPFSTVLGFSNQVQGGSDTGVLEVFSISSKDGSEINAVSIPVYIKG